MDDISLTSDTSQLTSSLEYRIWDIYLGKDPKFPHSDQPEEKILRIFPRAHTEYKGDGETAEDYANRILKSAELIRLDYEGGSKVQAFKGNIALTFGVIAGDNTNYIPQNLSDRSDRLPETLTNPDGTNLSYDINAQILQPPPEPLRLRYEGFVRVSQLPKPESVIYK